jgi:uncharacterized RDD family membrane protein YckC
VIEQVGEHETAEGGGPVVNPVPAEARPFQGQRAGVVSRTIAGAIDYAVVGALALAGYLGWAALTFLLDPATFAFPEVEPFLSLLALGGVLFCYLTVFWATTGRTYGSHVMGLRVVNFRGGRMTWPGAVVRSAFCTVFPIGLFWCAVSRENRSVQDVVLRTSVVYDWQPKRNHVAEHPERP